MPRGESQSGGRQGSTRCSRCTRPCGPRRPCPAGWGWWWWGGVPMPCDHLSATVYCQLRQGWANQILSRDFGGGHGAGSERRRGWRRSSAQTWPGPGKAGGNPALNRVLGAWSSGGIHVGGEEKGSPSEGQRWETLCPAGEGATVSFIHSFIHSVFSMSSMSGAFVAWLSLFLRDDAPSFQPHVLLEMM